MKKNIKKISLLLLVLFSFFYTDKVINLINKKDPLMIKINSVKDEYNTLAVDATIVGDTIIPGINGKIVDIDKSYEKMKLGGVFREDSLVYIEVHPSNSINNNIDKYIVKGNNTKKEVSIIYIIKNNKDIEQVQNINNITLFIESTYLNIDNINKLKNKEIYTYGKNGVYSEEILSNDNTLISRISNNKSIYCLSNTPNDELLKVCNNNNMHVIIPNIIGNYLDIKNNLSNGSIILLDSLSNINIITKYIYGKGYDIVSLSKLLEE